MTRHEFTAPDGSRRWTTETLARHEAALRWSRGTGAYLDDVEVIDDLLKPQPSGLRWKPWNPGGGLRAWQLMNDGGLGIGYVAMNVHKPRPEPHKWVAKTSFLGAAVHCGTLAECARALVAEVTK